MNEDPDVDAVASIIDDECSRCMLVHANDQHMSVSDLADRCGVTETTVYRKLDRLRELDLVVERTQPDEDGHHYTEYRTNLDRLTVEVTSDGFELRIDRREPMAKRLTTIVERL